MKKLLAIVAVCLIGALTLCACTSQAENIKKKYEKEKYTIVDIEKRDIRTYGIDTEKTKTSFAALKNGAVAFVVEYKSGSDAKDLYDRLRDKATLEGELVAGLKYTVVKKNNTVIFGNKDAVGLIK